MATPPGASNERTGLGDRGAGVGVTNVAHLLEASAQRVPSAPALMSGDRLVRSYRGLAGAVAARAETLRRRHGIGPGSRVVLHAGNCPEYLEVLFAVWWTGATVVPLSAMLHPREVVALAADCGAALLVLGDDLAGPFDVASGLEVVSISSLAGDGDGRMGVVERAPGDPAWVFYTSGTTGTPKGAELTHANLLAMTLAHLSDVEFLDERSGLLHLALISHAGGLFALPYVARGARQVLPLSRTADPDEAWQLLASQERLSFFVPPVVLRRLVANGAASAEVAGRMGTVLVGAAPVLAADLRSAVQVFGARVWNGYGQGESPLTITAHDPRQIAAAIASSDGEALASVGYPRTATRVRVVDGEGRLLPDGEVGEVVVAGATVMSGYLGRPDATAATLKGGWLHTGDVGRFAQGRLTLLDRSKDLVITGGANVYPREVEDALIGHPSVQDVAVVGVPDDEWGERVVAFVVPAMGVVVRADELDQHCLDRIARYKRPKEYRVVAELPRNGAGKVLKTQLRAAHHPASGKEWT